MTTVDVNNMYRSSYLCTDTDAPDLKAKSPKPKIIKKKDRVVDGARKVSFIPYKYNSPILCAESLNSEVVEDNKLSCNFHPIAKIKFKWLTLLIGYKNSCELSLSIIPL